MCTNNATENLENDLQLIHDLSVKWKMVSNPDTTRASNNYRPVVFDGIAIKPVDEQIAIANRGIAVI